MSYIYFKIPSPHVVANSEIYPRWTFTSPLFSVPSIRNDKFLQLYGRITQYTNQLCALYCQMLPNLHFQADYQAMFSKIRCIINYNLTKRRYVTCSTPYNINYYGVYICQQIICQIYHRLPILMLKYRIYNSVIIL